VDYRPRSLKSFLKIGGEEILTPAKLIERFKNCLIKWIVIYQIAFIAVEAQAFRDLIATISSTLLRAWYNFRAFD